MVTPERTAFFINKRARPEAKTTAIHLAQKISESTLAYLNGVALDLDGVNTAVVAGGDGSVGSVMRAILVQESSVQLVVIPGGSQNGLYHALKDTGATVTASEKGVEGTFLAFHPGSVNEVVFHHAAGWDGFMVKQGIVAERLRSFFPRKFRGYLGGAWALTVINPVWEENEGFIFRMAVTAPYCGSVRLPLFNDLSLNRENIGMMSVSGQSPAAAKAKVGLLAAYVRIGIRPPPSVVGVEEKPSFTFSQNDAEPLNLNADGEVTTLPACGTIYIRKLPESLPVAALIF